MAKNNNLHSAKKAKNDEFYTRIDDVEKELKYYKHFFKGKKVLCNCNDGKINGEWSAFAQYFSLNFEHLGLEKLTCVSYNEDGHGMKYVYCGDKNGNCLADDFEWEVSELKGHGDFLDEEGCQMMQECDVVVTNPPFSLFRDFVAQLVKYDKKFLIIGNMNAITFKEIFPLIKENKLWVGISTFNNGMYFAIPNDYEYKDTYKFKREIDGKKVMRVASICWFTNIEHSKRNLPLDLYKKYNPKDYPKYDNYDAINVDKVTDIPMDYDGVMGVPITFLDKYCPTQFEIVGLLQSSTDEQAGIPNLRYYNDFLEMRQNMSYTGSKGGKANGNPVLKGKSNKGNFLYNETTKEYVHSIYARIVIRRK